MSETGVDEDGRSERKENQVGGKTSVHAATPPTSHKEVVPSSPSLRSARVLSPSLTHSTSQVSTSLDSDTEVAGKQSPANTAERNSSKNLPVHSKSVEGKDSAEKEKDSLVDSDFGKEKKKDTSRFFTSPKMRGAMFPFDQISAPMSSHCQKNTEMHKIFPSLPESEKLIADYSCALQRDFLIHGRLYATQNWICFYANIFTWETLLTISFKSVTAITKERTAFVIPNAIHIATTSEKYAFSSLMGRDATYTVIFKMWQNSLLDEHLSPLELLKAVRKAAGEPPEILREENLWGEELKAENSNEVLLVVSSVPTAMPTHMEINSGGQVHIAGSDLDSDEYHHVMPTQSLPGWARSRIMREEAVEEEDNEGDGQPAEAIVTLVPITGVGEEPYDPTSIVQEGRRIGGGAGAGGGGGESVEKTSMAESWGSLSEFETISFTDQAGEIDCGCTEHIGRTIINDVYAADVETIFQLLFTDSDFFKNFLKARKTINIDIGEWQEQTDSSRLRDLNYTVALNYSFGPKFSPATEHQVYSKMGQPGLKHLVHTEVVNRNIPYADTFFVSCQYCMTRVAHDKARLRITANINFRRNCWGVVKNLIEKNAGDGVRSYYNHLDSYLKEHLASLPVHCKRHGKRVRRTSRQKSKKGAFQLKSVPAPPTPVQESPPPPSPISLATPLTNHGSTSSLYSFKINGTTPSEPANQVPSARPPKKRSPSFPQVNLALTLLLGILIISNMALYHHLMSYQTHNIKRPVTADHYKSPTQQLEWPTSRQDWIYLMRRHLENHEAEKQMWLDTVTSLVTILNEVESSISLVKQQLNEYLSAHDPPHYPPPPHHHPPAPSPSPQPPSHEPSHHHPPSVPVTGDEKQAQGLRKREL